MIFVDGTHVDHRCKKAFQRDDLDFGKFFNKLAEGTQLIQVVYCAAPYRLESGRKHQQGVINRLRRMYPLVKIYEGRYVERTHKCNRCNDIRRDYTEKGTDVAVAVHLVQAACCKQADQLILVSGDNDYWPALHVTKDIGANCRFAYFLGPDEDGRRIHNEVAMLRNNSRGAIVLDDGFMADCWYTGS
jgi:uncharacterized LabA/DUF88 family protein